MVVGASARDIFMHHVFDFKIKRATLDIDFGIELSDWDLFEDLKNNLLQAGFSKSETPHKLFSPSGMRVDIIPFGQIEEGKANINSERDFAENHNMFSALIDGFNQQEF